MKPQPSQMQQSSVLVEDSFLENKSALFLRPSPNLQPTPKPGFQPSSPF
jgi:hypothetical protein